MQVNIIVHEHARMRKFTTQNVSKSIMIPQEKEFRILVGASAITHHAVAVFLRGLVHSAVPG